MGVSSGLIRYALPCSLLLLAPDALALQQLCTQSPENPTVVLGLLGSAVAGYPYVREKLRTRFKRKDGAATRKDQE